MQYSFFDKLKYFSLQHRKLVVFVLSVIILFTFFGVLGLSFSARLANNNEEFDEIQWLIDEIERKDANIQNTLNLKEIPKVVKGIDVSSWQGKINWEKVNKAGLDFVIIRAGLRNINDKKIQEDKYFKYNISQANKYNIPVGVYFYSTAKNEYEVLEEATFVLNLIKDYKITYPIGYDLEAFDEGRLEKVSDERINYDALIFLDYFKAHGYEGMLYSNKNDIEHHWDLERFESYKIWFAHYIDDTNYTGTYNMWQYSSDGRVDGITGRVDLNEAYFAYEEVLENNNN